MSDVAQSGNKNHSYKILGYPEYFYFTGICNHGRQVLLVVRFPQIVGLFFDPAGNLEEIQERELAPATKQTAERFGLEEAFADQLDEELLRWQREMAFGPSPISVRRFFLEEFHLGIVDFPDHFLDVRSNPDEYSEEDKEIVEEEIERWKRNGQFVLWLDSDNNYWIDASGCVVSS